MWLGSNGLLSTAKISIIDAKKKVHAYFLSDWGSQDSIGGHRRKTWCSSENYEENFYIAEITL